MTEKITYIEKKYGTKYCKIQGTFNNKIHQYMISYQNANLHKNYSFDIVSVSTVGNSYQLQIFLSLFERLNN